MAERRMLAKSVVDSDEFLDMPSSAQNLYFHLSIRADDDGFITPRKVMRLVRASDDDLRILMAKKFIIPFESGVVVIRHWKINNYLRSDRHTETVYQDELSSLEVVNNLYVESQTRENGIPSVNQLVYPDKDSIGKDSIDKSSIMSGNEAENGNSDLKTIIEYLNLKAKKSFRATTKLYERHINARLSEGYTLEDFKHVIDVKCAEWMNTDHEQYLRPDTLFAPSHFDSYLNQKIVKAKPKSAIYFSNDECREQMKNETPTF